MTVTPTRPIHVTRGVTPLHAVEEWTVVRDPEVWIYWEVCAALGIYRGHLIAPEIIKGESEWLD